MKKTILSLSLLFTLNAQADFLNFFDFTQFGQALLTFADGVNQNLEKIRLLQNEKLPIREQWDLACETTQSLNQSVVALNKMFAKYKVNQQICLPLTAIINLQVEVVKNCQNYYSKPVPDNAEVLISKVTGTLLQSKLVLTKCFPLLNSVKFPGLP